MSASSTAKPANFLFKFSEAVVCQKTSSLQTFCLKGDERNGFLSVLEPLFGKWTALHYCAYTGYVDGVRLLLHTPNIDVDKTTISSDGSQLTALQLAIQRGNAECALHLIQFKKDKQKWLLHFPKPTKNPVVTRKASKEATKAAKKTVAKKTPMKKQK
mmetsp:Transcript_11613/g.17421  ORF Transcript_11613/g.17421 Transcript_11613/m.17421 type:complete len:158 (+) Transcript_11613:1855-2328(+)